MSAYTGQIMRNRFHTRELRPEAGAQSRAAERSGAVPQGYERSEYP